MNKMRYMNVFFILFLIFIVFFSQANEYIIVDREKSEPDLFILNSNEYNLGEIEGFERRSYNSFSVNLTNEQVDYLKKNSRYKIYSKLELFQVMMDYSHKQINGNSTWLLQHNNVNLTGLYQTVCVIDTGVDYNHLNLGGCYGENNVSSHCKIIGGWDFVNDDNYPLDDNGHGTHIAGTIISNHSIYKGIASDSKIIAMKAFDSGGSGIPDDISNSIDWCVSNASKFNISVISMSFGSPGTFYNSYCNSWNPWLYNSIQNAIENNISVVVSSGNCKDGGDIYRENLCDSGISAPACMEGVIPVGAVNDNDEINYQRGELFQLLAPGVNIYSTILGGGFGSMSGTSMSAPHVSGAVLMLKQFYSLQSGRDLTNDEVKTALNSTRIRIIDSGGNELIYPRLDIYSSIISLDSFAPEILLDYPLNETLISDDSQIFRVNLSDLSLKNLTFYLWNSTSLVNETSENISGANHLFEINITNLEQEGSYYWTLAANDENNNYDIASNYSLFVSSVYVVQNFPSNNTFTNINDTNFSCMSFTAQESDLLNVTFAIYNSTNLLYNESKDISGVENTTVFNYTLETEADYVWHCISYNNNSISFDSGNFTLNYDVTIPDLIIDNGKLPASENSNSATKIFYFNVSDNNDELNCSVVANDIIFDYNVIENYLIEQNFTIVFSPGTYNWFINCTDMAGNINSSDVFSFTITGISSPPSGGGSSSSLSTSSVGGSLVESEGTENNPVCEEEIRQGYVNRFSVGHSIYFKNSYDERHSLKLNGINGKEVNVTISSEPINLILSENQEIKLNLSNKRYLDTLIKVLNVTLLSAEIKISEIREENPDYNIEEYEERVYTIHDEDDIINDALESPLRDFFGSRLIVKVIFLILIFLFVFIIIIVLIKRYNLDRDTSEIKISKIKDRIIEKRSGVDKKKRKERVKSLLERNKRTKGNSKESFGKE
jgi:hypothetical protein